MVAAPVAHWSRLWQEHAARQAPAAESAYRRLGLFQLALREGISRGSLDLHRANDLMSQTVGLMRARGWLMSPPRADS